MAVQVIKTGDERYEVHMWSEIGMCEKGKITEHAVVGRVTLDKERDRYFVERPQWEISGFTWIRIPRPYVTRAAALRAITHPGDKQ